jgi:uncharacterized damage-inducible protein DinB
MESLIEKYAQGYDMLKKAVDGLSEEELHYKPAPDKWSIHEIVVHVCDADLVGVHRMKAVISEDNPTLIPFDQDLWATRMRYSQQSLKLSLELFRLLRESLVPVLRSLQEQDWHRKGTHTEAGPLTLHDLLQKFVNHLQQHLAQIERVRQAYAAAK